MVRLLVVGGSKGIGLKTVQQGLAAGHFVRAFARSAQSMSLSHPELEKRNGDALSAGDVNAALEGVDVVIQTMGVPLNRDTIFGPVTLFSASTRVLVEAMERSGVDRLLSVTGFGAGDSQSSIGCVQKIPFRIALGRAYDDKAVQERIIKESKLRWTIARPGVLTHGRRTGRYSVLAEPSEWRNGLISRADVADFFIHEAVAGDYVGKAPVLISGLSALKPKRRARSADKTAAPSGAPSAG